MIINNYNLFKLYIGIFLLVFNLYSDDKINDSVKWSSYQGKKTWNEAKERCESINMRLPTISEIDIARHSGTTKMWEKYSGNYWTINFEDRYNGRVNLMPPKFRLAVNVLTDEEKSYDRKWNSEAHSIESQLGVYCADITENSNQLLKIINYEEKYPERFYIEDLRLEFNRKSGKDGKPYYLAISEYSKSWFEARDLIEDLNKKEDCLNCYRFPLKDEVEKGKNIWLETWSVDITGMTVGNIFPILPPFFVYTFDYLADVIAHPLTWQSYVYPISPDTPDYKFHFCRTASRSHPFCFSENIKAAVIRTILDENIENFNLKKAKMDFHNKKFTQDFGKMKWDEANKKCKSIGMRLPTPVEFLEIGIYKINLNKGDIRYYWTSVQHRTDDYHTFEYDSSSGRVSYSNRDSSYGVICHSL
jgi:hypothetical protein